MNPKRRVRGKSVLVTGGVGYIGSIATVQLGERGGTPVVLDSFANSHSATADRVSAISRHPHGDHPI
jgi:UDP-glucose 4-epimerase